MNEYSLELKPIFLNSEDKDEYIELYLQTRDTSLFKSISFVIYDENKRIVENLVFPSEVLDDIINIVCEERSYSVVTYNLPMISMLFNYEITFLTKEKYLILNFSAP